MSLYAEEARRDGIGANAARIVGMYWTIVEMHNATPAGHAEGLACLAVALEKRDAGSREAAVEIVRRVSALFTEMQANGASNFQP